MWPNTESVKNQWLLLKPPAQLLLFSTLLLLKKKKNICCLQTFCPRSLQNSDGADYISDVFVGGRKPEVFWLVGLCRAESKRRTAMEVTKRVSFVKTRREVSDALPQKSRPSLTASCGSASCGYAKYFILWTLFSHPRWDMGTDISSARFTPVTVSNPCNRSVVR